MYLCYLKETNQPKNTNLLFSYALAEMTSVITWMRRICTAMLVCLVAAGTMMSDPRFTILLLPPFCMYYFDSVTEEDLQGIYILRVISKMEKNRQRAVLGLFGLSLGLVVSCGPSLITYFS